MVTETEPSEIIQARKHLAKFECNIMGKDGVYHLSEGLTLLEDYLELASTSNHSELAQNIGNTYVSKACESIGAFLENKELITEPSLENYFKLLTELECFDFGNKEEIGKLKYETIKLLFKELFRGYSEAEKKKIFKQLLEERNT